MLINVVNAVTLKFPLPVSCSVYAGAVGVLKDESPSALIAVVIGGLASIGADLLMELNANMFRLLMTEVKFAKAASLDRSSC